MIKNKFLTPEADVIEFKRFDIVTISTNPGHANGDLEFDDFYAVNPGQDINLNGIPDDLEYE